MQSICFFMHELMGEDNLPKDNQNVQQFNTNFNLGINPKSAINF
jgi:hypothetical protein